MYRIIWWMSLIIAFAFLIYGIVLGFLAKSEIARIFSFSLIILEIIIICLLIENMRISNIMDFLRKINVKNISSKEKDILTKEISFLKWAIMFLSAFVVLIVAYLLNHGR